MSYIDYSVGQVIPLKNKFGFRIRLYFPEGEEKVQQIGGFDRRKDAQKYRDSLIVDLHRRKYILDDSYTVKSYFDMWLRDVMLPRVKASTYATYFYSLKNHIYPNIAGLRLSELNRSHIISLYSRVAEYSVSAAKMCRVILKTGLQYAEQNNLIAYNLASDIPIPRIRQKLPYRMCDVGHYKTFTEEQLQILIEKSKDTGIYLYILFAGLLGLRKGEIRGLKYSDIDYIHSTIHISRQLGEKAVREDNSICLLGEQEIATKTKSGDRVLYMPELLMNAVLEERARYEENRSKYGQRFQDTDYICCNKYGKPHCKSYSYEPFKRLLRDAGLPDIRFHDLRHTYATLLLKESISSKAISVSLGHAKTIVTIDVYGDKKQIIDGYEADMENILNVILPEGWQIMNGDPWIIHCSCEALSKRIIRKIVPKE